MLGSKRRIGNSPNNPAKKLYINEAKVQKPSLTVADIVDDKLTSIASEYWAPGAKVRIFFLDRVSNI